MALICATMPVSAAKSSRMRAVPDADPERIRRQAPRIAIGILATDKVLARFELPDTFGDGSSGHRVFAEYMS